MAPMPTAFRDHTDRDFETNSRSRLSYGIGIAVLKDIDRMALEIKNEAQALEGLCEFSLNPDLRVPI